MEEEVKAQGTGRGAIEGREIESKGQKDFRRMEIIERNGPTLTILMTF